MKVLFYLFIILPGAVLSQNPDEHKEINEQVWKPFTQYYNTLDAKGFNSIHSDDVMRVSGGRILIGQEYKSQNIRSFAAAKNKRKREISFSFEQRTVKGDVAYEVGYYKIKSIHLDKKDSPVFFFYGRFHVVLKKTKGIWKITQDWDTGKVAGDSIGEKHFNSGRLLKLN